MKIKEVVNEGVLGDIAGLGGALVKGVGKGVADLVAPGAVDKFKSIKPTAPSGKSASPHIDAYLQKRAGQGAKNAEFKAAFDEILKKARAQGNKINMDDIHSAFGAAGLAEAKLTPGTPQYDTAVQAVVAMLQKQGVEVTGQSTKPAAVKQGKNEISWDPNRSLLTIGDEQYQKMNKGWKNWYNKTMVTDPVDLEKIQTEFEYAVGMKKRPSAPKVKPVQITAPNGEVITKNEEDGNWYDEEGAEIVRPEDVAELERRARPIYQNRQMQGQRIPPKPGTIPKD